MLLIDIWSAGGAAWCAQRFLVPRPRAAGGVGAGREEAVWPCTFQLDVLEHCVKCGIYRHAQGKARAWAVGQGKEVRGWAGRPPWYPRSAACRTTRPWPRWAHSTKFHPGGKFSICSSPSAALTTLHRIAEESLNQVFDLDWDLCEFWLIEGDMPNFNCNQKLNVL